MCFGKLSYPLRQFFFTEFAGVWTTTESWEKETRKSDRTTKRSVGRNGKMCCYGMVKQYSQTKASILMITGHVGGRCCGGIVIYVK